MSSLAELKAGDPIVIQDQQKRYRRQVVAKVSRVWLTDDRGNRFRIQDGQGEEREQFGRGFEAMTVAEWQVMDETERLKSRLLEWGWLTHRSVGGRSLTLPQMRRAVALIAEFEAENAASRP